MKRIVNKYTDRNEMSRKAAEYFVDAAKTILAKQPRFTVALSGGSTPKAMYQTLVQDFRDAVEWEKIVFFWSDERDVPLDHPDSNAGMALENLLKSVNISESRIFPVPTESGPPEKAAALYEQRILNLWCDQPRIPQFDLIFLGLGDDGHTASLFPGTDAVLEQNRLVAANWVASKGTWRYTFTFPLLNSAHNVVFLAGGANKAPVVADILNNPQSTFPAAYVKPVNGTLFWFLDADAAADL